jgi:catalase
VLQARLFSYPDSQRHRLDVNYQQIPVNAPLHAFNPYQRDGFMNVNGNSGARPNYPSSFQPLKHRNIEASQRRETWSVPAISTQFEITPEDYVQADGFWQVLGRTEGQQDAFVYNVSSHLKNARIEVRKQTYDMFTK